MELSYLIKRQAHIYIFNILFHLLFIFKIIQSKNSECGRNEPFLLSNNNKCSSEYCSKERIDSKDCIINNTIIKTQWLNNIILIGGKGFRYINFASYPNGDMIIETTSNPKNPQRIFFGLTFDGKPLFKENEEEKYFYSINITDGSNYEQYEAEHFIIKSSNGENYGKEYFFSVSKVGCNAELFDFENDRVYVKTSRVFTGYEFMYSYRNAFISLEKVSSEYNYLFGFIAGHIDDYNRVHFQIHKFNSISGFKDTNTVIKEIEVQRGYGNMVSCYLSPGGLIYCFYLYADNYKVYFRLDKYEKDLTGNKFLHIESNLLDKDQMNFHKCINFKDEVSVLAFYGNFTNTFYPIFLFRNYNKTIQDFEEYIPGNPYNSGMYLNRKEFSYHLGVNDIIKISENKLAFSCVTKNKDEIYIIIIKMFDNKKLSARYYSIYSFMLYRLKVLLDLRMHKYNDFISFAASFCSQEKCEKDEDEHFSSLIIFSYPNGTDCDIDLEQYLYDNNNIKIDRIEINLKNQLNIDNNIFGHIFSSIIIQNILLSENYKLYSSKDESKEIKINTTLEDNETIILEPQRNGINLPSLFLSIEYYFITKEPQYQIFENYPVEKEGESDEQFFEQDEFKGKLNYYKIKSNFELTSECSEPDCELCFYSQRDICLTCKNNFTTTIINNKLSKVCYEEKETDFVTENITEKITPSISDETPTEIIIDETNEKTEKITDKITIGDDTENLISDEMKNENKNVSCINEELLKNKYCNGTITEEQIGEIHDNIKDAYVNKEHKGNNTIFKTDNVIFQVSTHEDQKNSDYIDISSIDLGICEETLKLKNGIPKEESLIILKTDVKSEDLSQTYVFYEIYNPINLQILNLSDCKDDTISINTPVNLDEGTTILYSSLKDAGYNLFNSSDDFYNDVCSKYTSINGTDITMADRKNIIFNNNGNISLCQKRCSFEDYNIKTRKVKCNCFPQTRNKFIESLDVLLDDFKMDNLGDSFFNTLKHSNILVLRCYKLALNFHNFFDNKGRILMLVVVIFSLISLFYFYLKESKNIDQYITAVLNEKLRYQKNNNHQKELSQNKKNVKNGKKKSILKIISKTPSKKKLAFNIKEKSSRHKNSFYKKSSNMANKFNKVKSKVKNFKTQGDPKDSAPPKKKKTINNQKILNNSKNSDNNMNSKNFLKEDSHNKILNKSKSPNNRNSINIIKIKNVNVGIFNNKNKHSKEKEKDKNVNRNNIKKRLTFNRNKLSTIYGETNKIRKDKHSKTSKPSFNRQLKKKFELKPIKDDLINKNLTDQELNNLIYEKALILDKRSFFQYYFSLLRTKHIILFTFCQPNDYNLFSIKLCLFLLSFSLYLSINCFFFDDNTMHNFFIENGKYNFIFQLPQILLSSIISIIISIFLKELSLTEKSILSFKENKILENIVQKSSNLKSYLKMKILIFFIIYLLLLFFFLYFISCFCAVYQNTQIILFKDTSFSFLVSLLYPFAIYFLPPMFRIPALRASKKDKNVVYKIGNIIALL